MSLERLWLDFFKRQKSLRSSYCRGKRAYAAGAATALGLLGTPMAWGQSLAETTPDSRLYLEAGTTAHGRHETRSLTVGFLRAVCDRDARFESPFSLHWGLNISRWDASSMPGRDQAYKLIGADLLGRYGFDGGTSPWFLEARMGMVVFSHLYASQNKRFSTAFQLTESFGGGRRFGVSGRHEVSLHLQHFSNGSINQPNPGENFLSLRYAMHF